MHPVYLIPFHFQIEPRPLGFQLSAHPVRDIYTTGTKQVIWPFSVVQFDRPVFIYLALRFRPNGPTSIGHLNQPRKNRKILSEIFLWLKARPAKRKSLSLKLTHYCSYISNLEGETSFGNFRKFGFTHQLFRSQPQND